MHFHNPYQGESRIIANPKALDEKHILLNPPCRDAQIRELKFCISPALRGRRPIHSWLYGMPGTGKSLTARYVVNQLIRETSVKAVYIDCRRKGSFYSVLEGILNALGIVREERCRSSKLDALENYLKNRLSILVLDELDEVPLKERKEILYNLCNLGSVGLVCIAENIYSLAELNDKITSRLDPKRISFSPYGKNDLLLILRERARMALSPKTWSTKTLESIATLAKGDARIAIQILRRAAEAAENESSQRILVKHVKQAYNDSKELQIGYILRNLSAHHRLLYSILKDRKRLLSGKLWKRYLRECKKHGLTPKAKRTFYHYLAGLKRMKLVDDEDRNLKSGVKLWKARR